MFSCHILYTVYILQWTYHMYRYYISNTFFGGILYIYTYSIYTFIYYIHILYTYQYIHIICRHIVDVYILYNVDLIQTLHRIALHCSTYITFVCIDVWHVHVKLYIYICWHSPSKGSVTCLTSWHLWDRHQQPAYFIKMLPLVPHVQNLQSIIPDGTSIQL